MMHQIKRMEVIRDYINKILENQEIACDEEWWSTAEAERELNALACADRNYITSSDKMCLEVSEKLMFAVFRDSAKALCEELLSKLPPLVKDSRTRALQLIFFVRDMRSRICLEQTFDQSMRSRLVSLARNASGNSKLTLHCTYVLDQNYDSRPVMLKNLNRAQIMQMPPCLGKINQEPIAQKSAPGAAAALNSMIFTVDLYQLVELYNLIGDRLFKNNVRFGINDFLGVDYSIRKTLEEEPEYFWFKNNGITMLVENTDFRPRAAESLLLGHIGPDRIPDFSVINGAQTINTAARFFFGLEHEKGMEEKLERAKKAQVLVRIIHVPEAASEEQQAILEQKAREISVSLNRQKPIKVEDIAFTMPFCKKLAEYLAREYAAGRANFQLVRRGEGSGVGQWMDLVQFSRARLACAGEPGEARSQGAKAFLTVNQREGEITFGNTTIFADDWMEAQGGRETEVFRRHYGAVWFAHRVAGEYEKHRRRIGSKEEDVLTVLGNGKWYFTAIVTQILNGFSVCTAPAGRELPDFTDFERSFDSVREQIPQAMLLFAEGVALYVRESGQHGRIDSNLFKNSVLYRELIQGLKGLGPLGSDEAAKRFERLGELLSPGLSLKIPRHSDSSPAGQAALSAASASDAGAGCIYLKGQRVAVGSMAQAMQETVRYILMQYAVDENKIMSECSSWLTDDRDAAEKHTGYFRSPVRSIEVNGKTYWLGTSSNTRMKCSQMKNLCRAAGVQLNEISWHVTSTDSPEFTW